MDVLFRGRPVRLSKDAIKNMHNLDVGREALEALLEHGEDFRDTKMSRGEVGVSIPRGGATLFAKLVPSYSPDLDEDIWLVKHVGVVRRER